MLTFLYYVIIRPLELLFEILFAVSYKSYENAGLSIVFLSFVVNLLVLPLYRYADKQQEEQRQIDKELERGVRHIKKVFHGDERFLMLQNYYRENNYKQIYKLKNLMPLLLQIPFFIAAYRFLSGQDLLKGGTLGPINNLGRPDGLISIAEIRINVLPIAMTVINLFSGIVYSKGHPLMEKIQLLFTAAVFFVLLYDSPSGLVFYWTLNNVFSLLKNIILKKLKHDSRFKENITDNIENTKVFMLSSAVIALIAGLYIPSSVIETSPSEFVNTLNPQNPVHYVIKTTLMSFGIWFFLLLIYKSAVRNTKKAAGIIMAFSISGAVTCMIFGGNKGTLSSYLQYNTRFDYSILEIVFNLVLILLIAFITVFLMKKGVAIKISFVLLIVVIICGSINVFKINNEYKKWSEVHDNNDIGGKITLSTDGKNVVVIMLDRAISTELPYVFNEKKELYDKFDGFVYYPNTVSFGAHTIFGAPALYGGYEYSPREMNNRSNERLVSKHNEALKVLPVLFDNNDYTVTVINPQYAGYMTEPDLSIYDDCPKIKAFNTGESFIENYEINVADNADLRTRNMMLYGLMRITPCALQFVIYDEGNYLCLDEGKGYNYQYTSGIHKSNGISYEFMKEYSVLKSLSKMTDISSDEKNTFLIMSSNITHEPILLQMPDYRPEIYVNNTEYDLEREKYQTINGRYIKLENEDQMAHYQVNMCSYLCLAEWFDWLREQGVYDNTRIIIVSDHGYDVKHFDDLILEDGTDIESFCPILMIKDFDSHGFDIDNEFMTNADVPALATQNIIVDPVNPFTGKKLNDPERRLHDQSIFLSHEWSVSKNEGNTFHSDKWYYVHDNVLDVNNWEYAGEQ